MDYFKAAKNLSMFTAKNLSIGYDAAQPVFRAINFNIHAGHFVALLGVNGIGKSTLLRTIAGLQKKVSGNIELNGHEMDSLSAGERARLLSIVLTEKIDIDHITVREFIALGRTPYTSWTGSLDENDTAEINRVINLMKMDGLQTKLFNRLSDGEKQKTMIARALCQQTPVMILDEPTAFLDFRNKREILGLLTSIAAEMKKAIILSTHDIDAALNHCNRFWIMAENKEFYELGKESDYRKEVNAKLFGPY
jgi:iron complex transport system ATP-binding protein